MQKYRFILFPITMVSLIFATCAMAPSIALSSGCNNKNPDCLSYYSYNDGFYKFLMNSNNQINCDYFNPDNPENITDVCESIDINDFPFDSTLYITALFMEAGHQILVGQDTDIETLELVLFDTDATKCFWNWGKWTEFDFLENSLVFEDKDGGKFCVFEPQNLIQTQSSDFYPSSNFQVCKLKIASKEFEVNGHTLQLPKGTWLIGFDDAGSSGQDYDYQDIILAASKNPNPFYSIQTSGNIITKGDYAFFTKCDPQTQECPATQCKGPDGIWEDCKQIPLSEFLSTNKDNKGNAVNTLSLPGETGGVVFSDTSENSPTYCSGGWCYY